MRLTRSRIAAALSLVPCLALGTMWARSMWRGDLIRGAVGRYTLSVQSERGLVMVNVSPILIFGKASPAELGLDFPWQYDTWPRFSSEASPWGYLGPRWWDRLGFGHYVGASALGQRVDQFVLPHYAAVFVTALAPAMLCARRLRGRRRANGSLCAGCGYDMRATPERCPECGLVNGVAVAAA